MGYIYLSRIRKLHNAVGVCSLTLGGNHLIFANDKQAYGTSLTI
jgi:hypothetical protein